MEKRRTRIRNSRMDERISGHSVEALFFQRLNKAEIILWMPPKTTK
jgi:hypothetical protein